MNQNTYFLYMDFACGRYLVHANGICAGYSLFSAVIVAVPRPSTMPKAWAFFLLDQVTYLTSFYTSYQNVNYFNLMSHIILFLITIILIIGKYLPLYVSYNK